MRTTSRLLLLAVAGAAALTACTGEAGPSGTAAPTAGGSAPVEQRTAQPRLAVTHDGGISVLAATDLSTVAEIGYDGFIRVNPAGDGRHVFVSTAAGFELLDLGTWREPHDDHAHHYTAAPARTGAGYPGAKPGHVVVHDGLTTLFTDGTGQVRVLESSELGEPGALRRELTVPAHHGVAVARADGSVVVSEPVGRTPDGPKAAGVRILAPDGRERAAASNCPGLHGEAAAADEALTFGCRDGALIVRGDEITKVTAAEPYARMGNHAGSPISPIVLADYKTDEHADLERPDRFALIDTAGGALRVVELDGYSYSFKSLGRGPAGEAILLGTDGALHVFDQHTGAERAGYPVIGAWTEPDDWQAPSPDLFITGSTAYVSDPATRTLIAVSLHDGRRLAETTLPGAPLELTGVTG